MQDVEIQILRSENVQNYFESFQDISLVSTLRNCCFIFASSLLSILHSLPLFMKACRQISTACICSLSAHVFFPMYFTLKTISTGNATSQRHFWEVAWTAPSWKMNPSARLIAIQSFVGITYVITLHWRIERVKTQYFFARKFGPCFDIDKNF